MSTTADIFNDLNNLLDSIHDLLRMDFAKNAPKIARELGAESQLDTALDVVISGLNHLAGGVEKLRGPLLQADTVVAEFEIIADSLGTFGTGQAFSDLTLFFGMPANTFAPLVANFAKGHQFLVAGLGLADILPSPESLLNTNRRLQELGGTLEKLKTKPMLPAATAQQS